MVTSTIEPVLVLQCRILPPLDNRYPAASTLAPITVSRSGQIYIMDLILHGHGRYLILHESSLYLRGCTFAQHDSGIPDSGPDSV